MKTYSKLVAVSTLVVLLLAGCALPGSTSSGSDSGSGGGTSREDGSNGTDKTAPECPVGTVYNSAIVECVEDEVIVETGASPMWLSPTATCSVPVDVDFEGYFDNTQMYEYLNCIVPTIDAWIDLTYAAMPHPAGYMFIPVGTSYTSACIDPKQQPAVADEMATFYCPIDKTVYLGEQATYNYYTDQGDASMAMAVSHEVGHHFENELGILDQMALDGSTLSDNIQTENLADCISGAYVNYLSRIGSLNVEDDINDLASILVAIASAEDDITRDHGTLDERLYSFSLSFESTKDGPLFECNDIIQGVTVVNP